MKLSPIVEQAWATQRLFSDTDTDTDTNTASALRMPTKLPKHVRNHLAFFGRFGILKPIWPLAAHKHYW